MTTIVRYKLRTSLVAVLSTGLLCACGGGSTASTNDLIETVSPTVPMQLSGTIVVEERNGKTVFDGWFVQSHQNEQSNQSNSSQLMEDTCFSDSINVDDIVQLGAASAAGENDDLLSNLQTINGSVKIQTRAGDFASLVHQQVGETHVYATEERWQSNALPDDSILSVDSNASIGALDGVDVPPLQPLVWITPESGVMSNAATTLRWEPTNDNTVHINLKLSAIDFRTSNNPVVTSIDCKLMDDGEFSLSAHLQQQLADDQMGIVVYAVRERVQKITNVDTALTVVQLSYPSQ